jgi:prepilin-type N-terminal cleavage/methylation domain-containing protein
VSVLNGKQNGFSLIEIVVSVALTAILGTGITTFTVQTITETNRSNAHMQAIQYVENAGYWVSRDVQMAQTVTPGPNAGFPLQLSWIDINQSTYQIAYTLIEGQIQRSLIVDGGEPLLTVVARSVNTATTLTNCSYTQGLLTFNVTATIRTSNVSRNYQIKKRPG